MQALSDMQVAAPQLRVLDGRGRLAPAAQLAYNDAPWMPGQALRFVHPKLSNEARALPDLILTRSPHAHAACCCRPLVHLAACRWPSGKLCSQQWLVTCSWLSLACMQPASTVISSRDAE
jgi:hypothetical protein